MTDEELNNQIKKIIKFSEPNKNEKTIFIWPEGIFAGYSYSEVDKFKDIFKKEFSKNHIIIFGINFNLSVATVFFSQHEKNCHAD